MLVSPLYIRLNSGVSNGTYIQMHFYNSLLNYIFNITRTREHSVKRLPPSRHIITSEQQVC